MRTPFMFGALPVLALTALMLSGCSADATSESVGDFERMPGLTEEGPETYALDESEGESLDQSGAELGSAPSAVDRDVITTGYLYVTVEAPLEAATEAASIVEAAGGRVDGRQEFAPRTFDASSGARDFGRAELVLRIPAERLTATLDDLKELGEVEELQLSSTDVTREVQDIDARVAALRSSITRLLALQDAAATVEDLIALETAISDRQAQLESFEAQQRSFAEQVGLSTVTLVLGSTEVAPVDEPDTFVSGLVAGWEALVAFGSGLLVGAGVLLPWLGVLGVLALAATLIVRGALRRRKAAAASAPSAARDTPANA